VTAAAQYLFLKHRLISLSRETLTEWAKQIEQEISYRDKWDLQGFRRADVVAPNFVVLTSDGFLIEVEGFVEGFLPPAKAIDPQNFIQPNYLKTEVAEIFRVFAKRIQGGAVLLAVSDLDDQLPPTIDALLIGAAEKFGSTIASANKINPRDIDGRIEYAIIADSGEVMFATGSPPLQLRMNSQPPAFDSVRWMKTGGRTFLVFEKPILNRQGEAVGEILLPKNFATEQHALHQIGVFNVWLAVISWTVAVILLCPRPVYMLSTAPRAEDL
jgi:hypothetical protein